MSTKILKYIVSSVLFLISPLYSKQTKKISVHSGSHHLQGARRRWSLLKKRNLHFQKTLFGISVYHGFNMYQNTTFKTKAKYRADTMIKMLELFLFLEFIFMHSIKNTEDYFFFRKNQKSNPHFLPRKKREKIVQVLTKS